MITRICARRRRFWEGFSARHSALLSSALRVGYAYARVGRREDAERIAAIQPRPIEQAAIFVALGDNNRAFAALTRALPLGPVRIGLELTRPEFAPLRGDSRLPALRKAVGLPE